MVDRRRSTLAVAALLIAAGCGLRTLTLIIHTPASCPVPAGAEPPACPLADIRSIDTRLVRQDGTAQQRDCQEVTSPLCTMEDLAGFVFLNRSEANDGIELIIEGRSEAACGGRLVLACDSFGDSVIDLTDTDEIPVFCSCPRSLSGP